MGGALLTDGLTIEQSLDRINLQLKAPLISCINNAVRILYLEDFSNEALLPCLSKMFQILKTIISTIEPSVTEFISNVIGLLHHMYYSGNEGSLFIRAGSFIGEPISTLSPSLIIPYTLFDIVFPSHHNQSYSYGGHPFFGLEAKFSQINSTSSISEVFTIIGINQTFLEEISFIIQDNYDIFFDFFNMSQSSPEFVESFLLKVNQSDFSFSISDLFQIFNMDMNRIFTIIDNVGRYMNDHQFNFEEILISINPELNESMIILKQESLKLINHQSFVNGSIPIILNQSKIIIKGIIGEILSSFVHILFEVIKIPIKMTESTHSQTFLERFDTLSVLINNTSPSFYSTIDGLLTTIKGKMELCRDNKNISSIMGVYLNDSITYNTSVTFFDIFGEPNIFEPGTYSFLSQYKNLISSVLDLFGYDGKEFYEISQEIFYSPNTTTLKSVLEFIGGSYSHLFNAVDSLGASLTDDSLGIIDFVGSIIPPISQQFIDILNMSIGILSLNDITSDFIINYSQLLSVIQTNLSSFISNIIFEFVDTSHLMLSSLFLNNSNGGFNKRLYSFCLNPKSQLPQVLKDSIQIVEKISDFFKHESLPSDIIPLLGYDVLTSSNYSSLFNMNISFGDFINVFGGNSQEYFQTFINEIIALEDMILILMKTLGFDLPKSSKTIEHIITEPFNIKISEVFMCFNMNVSSLLSFFDVLRMTLSSNSSISQVLSIIDSSVITLFERIPHTYEQVMNNRMANLSLNIELAHDLFALPQKVINMCFDWGYNAFHLVIAPIQNMVSKNNGFKNRFVHLLLNTDVIYSSYMPVSIQKLHLFGKKLRSIQMSDTIHDISGNNFENYPSNVLLEPIMSILNVSNISEMQYIVNCLKSIIVEKAPLFNINPEYAELIFINIFGTIQNYNLMNLFEWSSENIQQLVNAEHTLQLFIKEGSSTVGELLGNISEESLELFQNVLDSFSQLSTSTFSSFDNYYTTLNAFLDDSKTFLRLVFRFLYGKLIITPQPTITVAPPLRTPFKTPNPTPTATAIPPTPNPLGMLCFGKSNLYQSQCPPGFTFVNQSLIESSLRSIHENYVASIHIFVVGSDQVNISLNSMTGKDLIIRGTPSNEIVIDFNEFPSSLTLESIRAVFKDSKQIGQQVMSILINNVYMKEVEMLSAEGANGFIISANNMVSDLRSLSRMSFLNISTSLEILPGLPSGSDYPLINYNPNAFLSISPEINQYQFQRNELWIIADANLKINVFGAPTTKIFGKDQLFITGDSSYDVNPKFSFPVVEISLQDQTTLTVQGSYSDDTSCPYKLSTSGISYLKYFSKVPFE